MTFSTWQRFSPLTGVLAIACWIFAFALAGSNPDTAGSNAKIVSYYLSDSNQRDQIVGFFVFTAGVLLFLVFLAALRGRLRDAEGEAGRVTALAFGSGIVSAVLWFLAIAFFVAPAFAANDTSKFRLDPNSYRLLSDLGYAIWVGAVIVAAVLVWATSAIALRAGVLPKWFAWLGILAGVLQLFAIFFVPAFIFWGWVLLASVLLSVRRRPAVRTVSTRTAQTA
jgi:hypothetical protein